VRHRNANHYVLCHIALLSVHEVIWETHVLQLIVIKSSFVKKGELTKKYHKSINGIGKREVFQEIDFRQCKDRKKEIPCHLYFFLYNQTTKMYCSFYDNKYFSISF
jgi:hypothetical protein